MGSKDALLPRFFLSPVNAGFSSLVLFSYNEVTCAVGSKAVLS